MSGLFNGLFGDPQAQTLQAQQNAQQGAQQFQAQMFQQMLAQQQQAKQQAMASLSQYLKANPNPATQWGPIAGPMNTAPASIGGGTVGPNGANVPQAQMQGNPNTLALLAALLRPAAAPGANPGSTIPGAAPPPAAPAAPSAGAGGGGNPHMLPPGLQQLLMQRGALQ